MKDLYRRKDFISDLNNITTSAFDMFEKMQAFDATFYNTETKLSECTIVDDVFLEAVHISVGQIQGILKALQEKTSELIAKVSFCVQQSKEPEKDQK